MISVINDSLAMEVRILFGITAQRVDGFFILHTGNTRSGFKVTCMSYRILLISALLFLIAGTARGQGSQADERFYPVKKVVDGDTFWIDDGSLKGIKVRLIGIDAPESHNTGSKDKAPFGREASDFLTGIIGGKQVRLEYDAGHYDRYGRTLAYVYLRDGTFVNALLVREGYATVMTVPPNVKYADTFLKLARRARNQNRGMWGHGPRNL
jgi:micrococcal nuclease